MRDMHLAQHISYLDANARKVVMDVFAKMLSKRCVFLSGVVS